MIARNGGIASKRGIASNQKIARDGQREDPTTNHQREQEIKRARERIASKQRRARDSKRKRPPSLNNQLPKRARDRVRESG